MNSDIDGLARLVALPPSARSPDWQIVQSGQAGGLGPSDWGVAAIVELPSEERKAIVARAVPASVDLEFPRSFVLSWFPPGLSSLWKVSGPTSLRLTAQPLDAEPFLKPPLQNGFFLPFGGDGEIFLYLYTQ
jgi:hypothetical protein